MKFVDQNVDQLMNYVSLKKGGDMKIILKLLIFFGFFVFFHVGFVQESFGLSSKYDVVSKAKQGDADAQNNLGLMYFQGKGFPRYYIQAYAWFTKAAEQGNVDAQFNLGFMYNTGEGVPKDYKQAIYWYTKAAEQGDPFSQFNLGLMYFQGKGVSKDYKQAYAWWNVAASQRQQVYIKKYLDEVFGKMSPSQIEEGQKLSGELYEKIYNKAK